jgi:hypothetical protein
MRFLISFSSANAFSTLPAASNITSHPEKAIRIIDSIGFKNAAILEPGTGQCHDKYPVCGAVALV